MGCQPRCDVTYIRTVVVVVVGIEYYYVDIYIYTSQYLWKFHSLLFTKPGSLLLPPPLFSKPVAPPSPTTPLEEACSATQNTLINMKEATN